ncbi:hypothetical protein HNR46_000557 [Haloferula luteola]|uniref:Trypsin-like peptidase domain-containing protein n=1 Tax=Haloferula luteola TaxID=595692 RepID=A0A840UZB1_9BACT|nr:serine protease [Haloferula luteola]MBB5350333.1 hypothetical protein [Haloferula luteola]
MLHRSVLLGGWLLLISPSLKSEELPPPTSPSGLSEADQEKIKKVVQEHFNSVVLVEGDQSAGSGFVAHADGKTWVYTAAHVFCGNKKLSLATADGRKLKKFGSFQASRDADLVRIELLDEFDSKVEIGDPGVAQVQDPLLAVGNSGGAGVLTVLSGQILSLGPAQMEVSAGVIQGNSGGPIFSGESGEAIGVVTHLVAAREDLWAKDTDFSEVRRFATRLDRAIEWDEMPIGRFLSEKSRLDEFNRNTQVLFALSALDPGQAGLRLNTRVSEEGPTLLSILSENEDKRVVSELIEMNRSLGERSLRTSESDLKKRFSRFYSTALRDLNKDRKDLQPEGFSGYNRASARNALEWRDDAVQRLERVSSAIR